MLAAYVCQVVTRHASIQTRKALGNLVAMLFVDSIEQAMDFSYPILALAQRRELTVIERIGMPIRTIRENGLKLENVVSRLSI